MLPLKFRSRPSDTPLKVRKKKRVLLITVVSLWVLAIAYFGAQMMAFDNTPGKPALAPAHWPSQTALTRTPDRKQLIMFVHPECTCTLASLEQLRRLETLTGNGIAAEIVLWHSAIAHKQRDWTVESGGAKVFDDQNGLEARRFGAQTSGQTLIYDESGQLAYAGGLTVFRAEAGGDPLLKQILRGIGVPHQKTALEKAVFGCPINSSGPLASTSKLLWTSILQ